jgi:hypothetical protein
MLSNVLSMSKGINIIWIISRQFYPYNPSFLLLQEELNSLLGTSLTGDDMSEVESELQMMETLMRNEEVLSMPTVPGQKGTVAQQVEEELPSVPTTRVREQEAERGQPMLSS